MKKAPGILGLLAFLWISGIALPVQRSQPSAAPTGDRVLL
jgi:hypothetical protein